MEEQSIPAYRKCDAQVMLINPMRGPIPVMIGSSPLFAPHVDRNSIEIVQRLIDADYPHQPVLPHIEQRLKQTFAGDIADTMPMILELKKSFLQNITTQVTNKIARWAIEMRKAGVEGEDLAFTQDELKAAVSVVNYGQIGAIGDRNTVGSITVGQIDDRFLQFLKSQKLAAAGNQKQYDDLVDQIAQAVAEKSQSRTRIRITLLRDFLIALASDTVAQGVLAILPH